MVLGRLKIGRVTDSLDDKVKITLSRHDMRLLFLDLLKVVMNVDVEPLFALLELIWTNNHAEVLLLDWIILGSGKLYIH